MNRILFTLVTFFLVFQLFGKGVDITTETKAPNPTSELEEASLVGAHASLYEENGKKFSTQLKKGSVLYLKGFQLQVTSMTDEKSGYGTMYIPSLDVRVAVGFEDVAVAQNGSLNAGKISALTSSAAFANAEYSLEDLMGEKDLISLPFDVAPNLKRKKGFTIPYDSHFWMNDFEMTVLGGFGSFTLQAASPAEGDFFYFDKDAVVIDAFEFCSEDVDMPIRNGGVVDDFEFPIRILKGNPLDEAVGSYVTFSCDGLKNFNLQALYEFPKNQLVAAANPEDTVRALFTINSPKIGSFVASAIINPFEIPGVEDLEFTIDSAYFDYSDVSNPPNFQYADAETGEQVGDEWKGFYMKKLEISLPPAVTSFNGGNPLQIGATDIIYDKGNGLSGDVYAYNLLDIESGNLGGWGVAVDTFSMAVINNSMGDMLFTGSVFIPICGEGDDIPYNAILGQDENGNSAMAFVLDVAGEYTIPFLKDAKMSLSESSVAGVRYGSDGFEPYVDFTGYFKISIPAFGSIPEINLPPLEFQNFKLNDIDVQGAANQAQGAATAGLDKMSFGSFSFGGLNLADLPVPPGEDPTPAEEQKEPKVGGFPINIQNVKFNSVPGTDLKKLSFDIKVNFTGKSGSGISGDGKIGLYGKVNYAKIISSTPWEAVEFDKADVAEIMVEGKFGPVEFEGGFSFISDDPVYGTGVKGMIGLSMDLSSLYFEAQAVAQFGVSNNGQEDDYRYFFFDIKTGFNPGIPVLPGIDMYGIGGGFFFNMDKSYVAIEDDIAPTLTSTIDMSPGTSFSGSIYTPKYGAFGFNASIIMGMTGKPETFCADVGFGIQMNYETMGIEKITFDGTMYIMSKSFKERENASVVAQVRMEMDIANGVLSATYGFNAKAPRETPIMTGFGQGSMQMDTNPDDDNNYKNFFYFGKPRTPVTFEIGLTGIGKVQMKGYFMLGEDLPPPVPIGELHPLFAEGDFDNGSDLGNGSGLAFGMRYEIPEKVTQFLVFKTRFSAVVGFDASIKKYSNAICANTGEAPGFKGWYVKGRAYAAIEASIAMYVDVWFFSGEVDLISIGVAAQIQAELPNPTWVKGELYVRAKVLGIISVSTKVQIELGEKCELQMANSDPSAILADIKVISDVDPVDKDKAIPIYNEIRAAFTFPMGTGPNSPPPFEDRLNASIEDQLREFFPMMEMTLKPANGGPAIQGTYRWSEDRRIVAFLPNEILMPLTDYIAEVKVRWRMRFGNNPWENPETQSNEIRTMRFTTGERPDKIAAQMVDSDNQLPGSGQRNYFQGYGKPQIQMKQSGFAYLFAEEKTKTLEGTDYQVKYDYVIRLTDMKTRAEKTIPINGKPGDSGNERTIIYDGLDDTDFLEKEKIYLFEIVGVPRPDEDKALAATTEEVTESAGQAGVEIATVATTLEKQEPDPTKIFDILYQFHFKMSKFDNFRQKAETLAFIYGENIKGKNKETEDLPGFMLPMQLPGKSPKVRDNYLLYTVDEGFDKWDQTRLKNNIHFFEEKTTYNTGPNTHPYSKRVYEVKDQFVPGTMEKLTPVWNTTCIAYPFQNAPCQTVESPFIQFVTNTVPRVSPGTMETHYAYSNYVAQPKSGMGYAYRKNFGGPPVSDEDVDLTLEAATGNVPWEYDNGKYWYGITFPKKGKFELTADEKEMGEVETNLGYSGKSLDNQIDMGTTEWDFAFISKRTRGFMQEYAFYKTAAELIEQHDEAYQDQMLTYPASNVIRTDFFQRIENQSTRSYLYRNGVIQVKNRLSPDIYKSWVNSKPPKIISFEIWTPSNGKWNSLDQSASGDNPVIIMGREELKYE